MTMDNRISALLTQICFKDILKIEAFLIWKSMWPLIADNCYKMHLCHIIKMLILIFFSTAKSL